MLNGRKRRPTHPGELLREEIVPEQAVDIWETLEINRQEYSRIRPLKAA